MKTIGKLLKEARRAKKYSKEKLEKETKIKISFVEAIEEEKWRELPDFPVVQGFVKSIAKGLEMDVDRVMATLRRDYPPKTLPVNPKPDLASRFVWSPKLTFVAGVLVVSLAILGYLGFQYSRFLSPPKLLVELPKEEETVSESQVLVRGSTDSDATVTVNNQSVLIDQDGNFAVEIEITKDTNEIVVVSKSRSGKETVIRRKINPEFE